MKHVNQILPNGGLSAPLTATLFLGLAAVAAFPAYASGKVTANKSPAKEVVAPPTAAESNPASDPTAQESELAVDNDVSIALCSKVAAKLNSVRRTDCVSSGLVATSGRSVLGEPILIKKYGAVSGVAPNGRILLIGGIHGDEFSSVSIVFRWIRALNEYRSGLFDWTVVPLLNPDGLLNPRATRTNANGVDLNRNFPTPNWNVESQAHWIKVTKRSPRRYPGVAPLSEPESKWLAELIQEVRPDAIVSVHAPHGILDYDGPMAAPKRLGKLRLSLLGTYPGSLGNYAGTQNSIPVVTIELPTAGSMPKEAEATAIWEDLNKWLRVNVRARPQQVQTDEVSKKS